MPQKVLLLLYKFTGNPRFMEYEDYLENVKLFAAKYDPDKHHVMFIFDVHKKYQKIKNLAITLWNKILVQKLLIKKKN